MVRNKNQIVECQFVRMHQLKKPSLWRQPVRLLENETSHSAIPKHMNSWLFLEEPKTLKLNSSWVLPKYNKQKLFYLRRRTNICPFLDKWRSEVKTIFSGTLTEGNWDKYNIAIEQSIHVLVSNIHTMLKKTDMFLQINENPEDLASQFAVRFRCQVVLQASFPWSNPSLESRTCTGRWGPACSTASPHHACSKRHLGSECWDA